VSTDVLRVEVRSRQGLVFEGDLYAVSSYNTKGLFDVLPRHTNFISMIQKKVTLRQLDGRTDEIGVENGVMMVENNKVMVFLGVAKV
jgi:F0F1-type ATP synthase epsilon subunit